MTEDRLDAELQRSESLFEDSFYTTTNDAPAASVPQSASANRKPSVWYDPRSGGRVRYVESLEDGFYRKYILVERAGAMRWVRWKDPPRTKNERKLVFEKQGEGCFVERLIEDEDAEELIWEESDESEDERRRVLLQQQQYQSYFIPQAARKRSSWQSGDTDIHYDPRSNGCIRYERGEDGYYRKFRLQYRDGGHEWAPVTEHRNLSEVVYQRSPEGFYLEVLLPLPVAAYLPMSFEDCRLLREPRGWTRDIHTGEGGGTVFVRGRDKEKDSSADLAELIQRTSVLTEAERLLVNKHHLSPRPSPSGIAGRQLQSRSPAEWMGQRRTFDSAGRRKMTDLTDPPSPPAHHQQQQDTTAPAAAESPTSPH